MRFSWAVLLLKNLIFTIVVPGSVAGYVPYFLAGSDPPGLLSIALSAPLFILGTAMYTGCVWDFAVHGRGTPIPVDAPKRLVIRGVYQYVRNPMYLGVLTVILGWLVRTPSLALAIHFLVVCTLFHAFVVLYEEPQLRKSFGPDYEQYAARVGRWLPKFYHG